MQTIPPEALHALREHTDVLRRTAMDLILRLNAPAPHNQVTPVFRCTRDTFFIQEWMLSPDSEFLDRKDVRSDLEQVYWFLNPEIALLVLSEGFKHPPNLQAIVLRDYRGELSARLKETQHQLEVLDLVVHTNEERN